MSKIPQQRDNLLPIYLTRSRESQRLRFCEADVINIDISPPFKPNTTPQTRTFQMSAWIALIRTHHITSRKKVAALKTAAENHGVFAILRSGGSPGIMYVEGSEEGVKSWVSRVHVSTSSAQVLSKLPDLSQRLLLLTR
jgi:hypothetical protein